MKSKQMLYFLSPPRKLLKTILFAMVFSFITTSSFAQFDAGTISTSDETEICVDGVPDLVDFQVTGAFGREQQWVVTNNDDMIVSLPTNPPPFDFDPADPGICKVWYVASTNQLVGRLLRIGRRLRTNSRVYDVSNAITIVRNQPEGGRLRGGPFTFTVGDGVADNIPDGAIRLIGEEGCLLYTSPSPRD